MSKKHNEVAKVHIYGDTLMQKLCPILRTQLWIEVDHEVTIEKGTLRKLYRKLSDVYKTKPKTDNVAIVMIGAYDIMKYNLNKVTLNDYVKDMKRRLSMLVSLLRRTHRHVILLTAIPILKMQSLHYHWRLLRKYNKHLKHFANETTTVFDTVPLFLKRKRPPKCRSDLYEKTSCLGCPKSEVDVLWNENGILKVVPTIIQAVIDIQKINTVRSENVDGDREKCIKEAVMTAKVEEMCLRDEADQQPADASFNRIGVIIGMGDIEHEDYTPKMTPHMDLERFELQKKLSWMRWVEYSPYGIELIKSNKLESVRNELVTVATYNVLSQTLLDRHRYLYKWHDRRSLTWEARSHMLLEEFSSFQADIICLQEVDSVILDPFYNRHLREIGYEGVFKQRTNDKEDGCAIYFKSDKFNLVEVSTVEFFKEQVRLLDRDNIGIVIKLSMKNKPNVQLVVATTHLLYNPRRCDIKLAQTQLMLAEIEKLAYKGHNKFTGQAEYLPIIFTGDMNYSPESAVYQLVTKSYFEYEGLPNKFLKPDTDGWKLDKVLLPSCVGVTDSCQYLSSLSEREGHNEIYFGTGALEHPLNLESVYRHVKENSPEATTYQDLWLTVDYIFYSQKWDKDHKTRSDGNLKLVSKLTLPNTVEARNDIKHLPNLVCGSDHLPLLATFQLTGD